MRFVPYLWIISSFVVSSTTQTTTNATDIKLSNGNEGFVLIYDSIGESWHTVCDDEFGASEATVVCNELFGSGFVSHVFDGDYYSGADSGEYSSGDFDLYGQEVADLNRPIFDNLKCVGNVRSKQV